MTNTTEFLLMTGAFIVALILHDALRGIGQFLDEGGMALLRKPCKRHPKQVGPPRLYMGYIVKKEDDAYFLRSQSGKCLWIEKKQMTYCKTPWLPGETPSNLIFSAPVMERRIRAARFDEVADS